MGRIERTVILYVEHTLDIIYDERNPRNTLIRICRIERCPGYLVGVRCVGE